MQRLGVRAHLTCTEINFHPIVKPFEMGAYSSVMKRSIFLFDHRMCESWDFGQFSKKFDKKWTLEVADLVKKKFQKIQKNDEKCFSFIFVFIMFYWMYYVPQTWFRDPKPILHPLYRRKIHQISLWKWCEIYTNHQKVQKISFDGKQFKIRFSHHFHNEIWRILWLYSGCKIGFGSLNQVWGT